MLKGNPHYERAAGSVQREPEIAEASALLAIAHELRIANLIALASSRESDSYADERREMVSSAKEMMGGSEH